MTVPQLRQSTLTRTARDYWSRFGFEEIQRSQVPFALSKSHEWSVACPVNATAMRKIVRASSFPKS